MTKVGIIGAAGRMGGVLIRHADRLGDITVTAAIEYAEHPKLGEDAGSLAGIGNNGVALSGSLNALADVDACIDFSFHEAVPANMRRATELGIGVVLGTTGLTEDEVAAVNTAAEKIPIVWAPNMSLGVNVLFEMVAKAARALGLDYDAEIVEVHHRHKKDAPSGTALALAEKLAAGRDQDLKEVGCYGREGLVGERPRGEIGIHAVRSGDVVGEHTVSFATDGERLELVHRASSRDTFAVGAMKAAAWLKGREPGIYDMRDVLGL